MPMRRSGSARMATQSKWCEPQYNRPPSAAVVYFGVLLASGLNLKKLLRH